MLAPKGPSRVSAKRLHESYPRVDSEFFAEIDANDPCLFGIEGLPRTGGSVLSG